MDLRNYNLAVIYSHAFFEFAKHFVGSLTDNQIQFNKLYIGNAGLLDEDIEWLRKMVGTKLVMVDLKYKHPEEVAHQSREYHELILNRPIFWRKMVEQEQPFVHLDGDTAIISNNFCMLDNEADITLTTRRVPLFMHPEHKNDMHFLNAGVVFFNKPSRLLHNFTYEYERRLHELFDDPQFGQFDQPALHCAVKSYIESGEIEFQRVHCRYLNCYLPEWQNDRTCILHFKTPGEGSSVYDRIKVFFENSREEQ